jgi:hypothetical protein
MALLLVPGARRAADHLAARCLALALASAEAAPAAAAEAEAAAAAALHGADGAARVHDAALLRHPGRGRDALRGRRVDAEADPAEDTLLELVAHHGVGHDRVVAVGAHHEEEVARVGHHLHLVTAVRVDLVDLGQERLVEVDLPDVRGLAARDGVVGLLGGAEVGDGCRDVSTVANTASLLTKAGGHIPWMWVARPS